MTKELCEEQKAKLDKAIMLLEEIEDNIIDTWGQEAYQEALDLLNSI